MCIRTPNPGALPVVKMTPLHFSFSIPTLYSSAHSLLGESSGELGFPLVDFVNRTGEGGIVSDMLALWGDVSRPRCVNSAIYSQL